ncbi:choline transporter-like protein 2 isoform X3 [Varroa destructor]|uniref:Choline transporter-like protein n=1 Tax=Varroa destructor TaxID=109461 RepID=A0A7M7K5W7_VARDE|nr:choline transporter-like protein 2 isoform X3 [Varroa destructor]
MPKTSTAFSFKKIWKMGALANGESGNGSLSAVEMPERVTAPQDEPQPIEEELLIADTWEELDAAYKMDPAYEYPPEYGEPVSYDPNFKGPVIQRSCTDVFFLLLFIVFLAGWAILAGLAFKQGNINRVIYPSDSNGNICGTGKYADRPYLFFFDLFKCKPKFEDDEWIPTTRCRTPQVCVKECPSKTFSVAQYDQDPPNVAEIKKHMVCVYGTDMSKDLKFLTSGPSAPCAYYYISSVSAAGRCFPSPTSVEDEFQSYNGANITITSSDGKVLSGNELFKKAERKMQRILNARRYFERFLQDLSNSWKVILIGLFIAMVLALVWIVAIRLMAGLMVWLGILGILSFLIIATAFSWYKYISLKGVPGADEGIGFSRKISYYTGNRKTWLILGCLASVALSILILVIICLRERVQIATALIKEAAKAIGYMPTALIFPVFPYLLQLIVLLFTATVALLLMSITPSSAGGIDATMYSDTSTKSYYEQCIEDLGGYSKFNNKTCTIGNSALGSHVSYSHLYNFCGFLWMSAFIVAFGEMTLAAAVASYYWTRNKKDIPKLTVCSAMWATTRYHMGTLAFGSLIIATVSFIRTIIEYIEQKLKQYDNEVTKALRCCCRCFCWCLENFLRFINRNAYIMTAIYGENFCASARRSFLLLMRNVVRVVVVDKVTDFLLLASKLVVVGITSGLAYYVFSGSCEKLNRYIPELNYPLFPVFLIAFGAYLITTCFFDVYNMAVDTLFLCFLEDCERHDGSREKPYFMSKKLMLILKKKNNGTLVDSSSQAKGKSSKTNN